MNKLMEVKEELIDLFEKRQDMLIKHHKHISLEHVIIHGMVLEYYKIEFIRPYYMDEMKTRNNISSNM
tara:strand:- start:265 stop:468 length:204 start_codon:yes stop_codon:yes gene_type:complete